MAGLVVLMNGESEMSFELSAAHVQPDAPGRGPCPQLRSGATNRLARYGWKDCLTMPRQTDSAPASEGSEREAMNEQAKDPDVPEKLELTATEGGIWRAYTRDSSHIFDLDRGTVTRVPGANAPANIHEFLDPRKPVAHCTLVEGERPARWAGAARPAAQDR